ncbi:Alp7A family actin-like protein, partial [Gottfriedia acidiceleris]|uniref:Alp7A family actin-like protein n=1 Tax=Gottfriedia acidiceleris TaxID=371036 RepID=UPI0030007E45
YKVGLVKNTLKQHWDFTSRNSKKYSEEEWQTAFIISVYRQIKHFNIYGSLHITTGLPANDDKKNTVKEYLKTVFEKKDFCVNGKTFTVENLFFIGQGSASFFNDLYIINEDGELQVNKRFLGETKPLDRNSVSKILFVDNGFGTQDLRYVEDYVLQRESKENPGMISVWKEIIKELTEFKDTDDAKTKEKKLANEWLKGIDIHSIEDQIRDGKTIEKSHREVDISEAYEMKMMDYARKTIKRLYIGGDFDNLEFDQVRFVGGGSKALEPFLIRAIDEHHTYESEKKIYKFVPNPQTTNCLGYVKFGLGRAKKLAKEK